jgi:hypothetical protein
VQDVHHVPCKPAVLDYVWVVVRIGRAAPLSQANASMRFRSLLDRHRSLR